MSNNFVTAGTPPPSYASKLEVAHYEDIDVYMSPSAQRNEPDQLPNGEVRYVQGRGASMIIDRKDIAPVQTLTLIWGALGKTMRENAEDFGTAPGTVRTNRTKLYNRLGAASMSHAVGIAFERQRFMIPPGFKGHDLSITLRELEVLDLVRQGQGVDGAGQQLDISFNTARTHVQNVVKKNNVANMVHAITLAHLSRQLPRSRR